MDNYISGYFFGYGKSILNKHHISIESTYIQYESNTFLINLMKCECYNPENV